MPKHKTPKEKIEGFDIKALMTIVFDSDDSATALMAGTFLETFLELAVDIRLERKLSPIEYVEIFGGYGPLSTFSGKIAIAYAMKAINEDERDDLRIIKTLRNDCAHTFSAFNFDDSDASKQIKKLKLAKPVPKDFIESSKMASENWNKVDFKSNRGLFVLSFFNVFNMIVARSKVFAGRRVIETLKLEKD